MTEHSLPPQENAPFQSQTTEMFASNIDTETTHENNWFNIQSERMGSQDFRMKFLRFLSSHTDSLLPGSPTNALDKATHYQDHYTDQIEGFNENLTRVTSSVYYGPARDVGGSSNTDLGHGGIGRPGTVYNDAAQKNGMPLNDAQKDIIAAHEAYHGLIDACGTAKNAVLYGFDWNRYSELVAEDSISRPQYLQNPDELLARMAQFKNYFGMIGGEQFTETHLERLRKDYVADTGLDNGVTTMLGTITQQYEERFIALMNTLPV